MNPDNYVIEGLEELLSHDYAKTLNFDQLDDLIGAILQGKSISSIIEETTPEEEASVDLVEELKSLIKAKNVG